MKIYTTKKELLLSPNFATLPATAFNLNVYRKGKHEAAFISSLGRCFAESKAQRVIADRVEVGQVDIINLFTYVQEYIGYKDGMNFKYSHSGASCYLINITKELYDAIVKALIKYDF